MVLTILVVVPTFVPIMVMMLVMLVMLVMFVMVFALFLTFKTIVILELLRILVCKVRSGRLKWIGVLRLHNRRSSRSARMPSGVAAKGSRSSECPYQCTA